jgi:arginase
MLKKMNLIGAAIDACGNKSGAAATPDILESELEKIGLTFENIFRYNDNGHELEKLTTFFTQIATHTKNAVQNNELPIVIGGDHSCAIGTWSGITHALHKINQDVGIIWIDAHMDAHTPQTSLSGNIHGMPVATLLGHGYKEFLNILGSTPKIKPENIVLIGIRSFEDDEAIFLNKHGVQIYYNYDVTKFGLNNIFVKSWDELSNRVNNIGLSIDLDGFDPKFTPGVSTLEPDGIDFNKFLLALEKIDLNKIIGIEITEGNAKIDPNGITMKCIIDILAKIQNPEIKKLDVQKSVLRVESRDN